MPSVSRGLRTSTGCLTCRKRRVKCDETRPVCGNCSRVKRECFYAKREIAASRSRAASTCTVVEPLAVPDPGFLPAYEDKTSTVPVHSGIPTPESDFTQSWVPPQLNDSETANCAASSVDLFSEDNLFGFDDLSIPNFDLVEWYDLLASDAINDLQNRQQSDGWDFDFESLSRRQIPSPSVAVESDLSNSTCEDTRAAASVTSTVQPWNTETAIALQQDELVLFEHYINVVAPILDLFDPLQHFAKVVPDLALHNEGLLNALLAVGACHKAIWQPPSPTTSTRSPEPLYATTPIPTHPLKTGEHYYYTTLQHLSHHITNPLYRTSHELLITAVLISTYAMFTSSTDHSAWDRHLRRLFWIQRDSGISGESSHTLQRAAWCAWLRQDIWAAFCTGRPTLTLHQPNTPLSSLTPDALHQRIMYLAAKCVQFAATPKKGDIQPYIKAGETLMARLEAWKAVLPSSFEPISTTPVSSGSPMSPTASAAIQPLWIHPPANAAAVQMYHFARIITVLNQPSVGGMDVYQMRFRVLRESARAICGIAIAPQTQGVGSAFVSFQVLHAAALVVESQEAHSEVLEILDKVRGISRHPHTSVLENIVGVWKSVMEGNAPYT